MTKQHKPLTAVLYAICVIEALMLIAAAFLTFCIWFATILVSDKVDYSHVIRFVQYPETLTYVIGTDTEFNLDGMALACTVYGEKMKAHHMLDMNDPDLRVDVSDVDLTTPGVYTVYIHYFIEGDFYAGAKLPIEVIDPQQYTLAGEEE